MDPILHCYIIRIKKAIDINCLRNIKIEDKLIMNLSFCYKRIIFWTKTLLHAAVQHNYCYNYNNNKCTNGTKHIIHTHTIPFHSHTS